MSVTGLLRTQVEIWRATPSVGDTGEVDANYELHTSARCTARRVGGRARRGPAGEFVDVDLVAYFPPGTDIRPEATDEMPDRVRFGGRDYVCVFVEDGFGRGAPLRAGLRATA